MTNSTLMGWGFWLQWTLVTLVGFLVSLLLIEIGERPELGAIQGTIGGALIGFAQTLVISQRISQPWLWMLVNMISWGLMAGSGFGALGWFAPSTRSLETRLVFGAIFGAIGGVWLGGWQWLVLRKHFAKSWQWILTNLLGWSIGLSIGWTLGGILRSTTHLFLGEVLGLLATWIIVAVITGSTLKSMKYEV